MDQATQTFTAVHSQGDQAAKPCRSCGSAIGFDQRYCLNCGSRSDKRLPFASADAGGQEAGEAAKATAGHAGGISPALAVAAVCGAVLFLGTGVLLGRSSGGSNSQPAAQAPMVITQAASGTGGTSGGAASAAGSGAASGGKASTGVGHASKSAPVAVPKGAVVANSNLLNAADSCKTTKCVSEAGKKLPKVLVTPGAPPPIDTSKPPGGGGGGTSFN
jgi:hypothetical protein